MAIIHFSNYEQRFINKTSIEGSKIRNKYICKWILQIAIGIKYLHQNSIIHRDIKSQNVFLTKDYDIKIGDLGIAKILKNRKLTKTYIGTPYYMCPEIAERRYYKFLSDFHLN